MASQNHLFIIDPLEKLNLKLDTSMGLARALTTEGARVFFAYVEQLFWHSQAEGTAVHCRGLSFTAQGPEPEATATVRPLSFFHTVHMRKEPPFDRHFMAATWLLDGARTRVLNAPSTLRNFNEKLLPFQFPRDAIPSLVGQDPALLTASVRTHGLTDIIIKPIHLFGGRGIARHQVSQLTDKALEELLAQGLKEHGILVIQPFLEEVFAGEVRVFTAKGQAVAWCLKVPQGENFLANTSAGATLRPYTPSPELKQRIDDIALKLLREGVWLAGFDVIAEKVSEINITSPRLLSAEGRYAEHFTQLAQWLIS